MGSLILGTAGHIDHGKTALVRALTGTDTDRLKEEKARGITIELGFAELESDDGTRFGVVDVPGHEAFVRAMVAGAAGMDVVLLVVAADEGVMPQTREHVAIVGLLAVPELVVALTKCDAVEPEWLELVHADVADLLEGTRYADAPRVETSATEGTGLEELVEAIGVAARRVEADDESDLVRLPLDRVFTIQGTGTVVTGTLWSGRLESGARARILPQDLVARVRGLEVHGRPSDAAVAGDRVAVALTGEGGDRDRVSRGATLTTAPDWSPTWMLTVRVDMLPDTSWAIEHNQRVHVHHGTAEVLARCALLEPAPLTAGGRGWVQLRLEEPLVARAGDRFVLRSYSPVTTIAGGVVAEPNPRKRNRLVDGVRDGLSRVIDEPLETALAALVWIAGWHGIERTALPIVTGRSPREIGQALASVVDAGGLVTVARVFGPAVRSEAEETVMAMVESDHDRGALRPTVPMSEVRASLPRWSPGELAEGVIEGLVEAGRLEVADGGVRVPGYRPELSRDQERASDELLRVLADAGLAAPSLDELPDGLRSRPDLWPLVRRLEGLGLVRSVADRLYIDAAELEEAASRIRESLGGRTDLGPADFRDVLAVSRKHLIPILNYLDGRGITVRHTDGRDVPANETG